MPVFIDSSETRAGTTLPDIPDAITVPNLSQLTGADWLISTLSLRPRTKRLVQKHVESGALIVECKRMVDLPQSLCANEHLYHQAAAMSKIAPQIQCVLLYTGFHAPDSDGQLRIGEFDGQRVNWKSTRWAYQHFRNAQTKLMDSGLVRWEGLASNREIPIWIAAKLRHLEEYKTKPVKVLFKRPATVSDDHTLRELKVVDDARNVLIAMGDLFGSARSAAIMEHCGNSLAWALKFLSNPNNAGIISGVGEKTIEQFRERTGLQKNMTIEIVGAPSEVCWSCGVMYWDKDACPICGKGKDAN